MTIPKATLEVWQNRGAVQVSAATYASVQAALNAWVWPTGVRYEVYLQGSYANATNIRGDSDVDIVVELTSSFYSNLTSEQKQFLSLGVGGTNFSRFRTEVVRALSNYYGAAEVDDTGNRSIKVAAQPGRLKCDVVPSVTYKRYRGLDVKAQGITFWGHQDGVQVVNYPKIHRTNGENKNSVARTNGLYKPTVRMFKNARNRILAAKPYFDGRFPSYFVECLIFNAADSAFSAEPQLTYLSVIQELDTLSDQDISKLVCQNWQSYLFGNTSVQWNKSDAKALLLEFRLQWKDWA